MPPTDPYADVRSDPNDSDKLKSLALLLDDLQRAEVSLAHAEETFKHAQQVVNELSERTIPELMDEIGIEEFTTTDGRKVRVKDVVRTSITKANKPAAFAWLEREGHDGLIKRQVVAAFNRGESDKAKQVLEMVREILPDVKSEANVHPSTLKSFVTKELEAGRAIPPDLFGIHQTRKTVVK